MRKATREERKKLSQIAGIDLMDAPDEAILNGLYGTTEPSDEDMGKPLKGLRQAKP